MRNLKLVILAAPVIAIYSFAIVARHQGPRKVVDTHVYEPLIRGEATNAPTPEYPAEAIDARLQGLVDVAVVFDENGKTMRIKILESPGPSLSKAVESAVRQWTMRGGLFTLEHIPVRTVGELRFHFVIKDGVGIVENPTRDEQEIRSPAFRRVIEEENARPRN
jgi:TonB family protein